MIHNGAHSHSQFTNSLKKMDVHKHRVSRMLLEIIFCFIEDFPNKSNAKLNSNNKTGGVNENINSKGRNKSDKNQIPISKRGLCDDNAE